MQASSGWGISPKTLRLSLQTPAMSSTEPLGLAAGELFPEAESYMLASIRRLSKSTVGSIVMVLFVLAIAASFAVSKTG